MKIQSRPVETIQTQMTANEINHFIRNVIALEGSREGSLYRLVLTLGALSMLKQMGVITDYQARQQPCGLYDIWTQVRMPDGMCETLAV